MGRGISMRTMPRRHISRRSTFRRRCAVRSSTSPARSASRRRLRSGWRGGRNCGERHRTNRSDGALSTGEGGNAMRKIAMVVAASAAIVGGAGCSALGRAAFENPVVNLRNVTVAGVGLTGASLDVVLSVYNPNHYRLDATRLTYRVALAGDSVTLATGAL